MPKLDSPDGYKLLISIVYKNGAYWVYHNRSLYNKDGEIDDDFSHFDQIWQVIRLQNQKTKKLTTTVDVQNRLQNLKDTSDCVELVQGDIIKFGRVRFRVKKLFLTIGTTAKRGGAAAFDQT